MKNLSFEYEETLYDGSEEMVREILQSDLEARGLVCDFQTVADWGCAFRVRYQKSLFHVVIEEAIPEQKKLNISVKPEPRLLDSLFPKRIEEKAKHLLNHLKWILEQDSLNNR